MKIDFEYFTLYKGIDKSIKEMMDVRQVFAEEMWNHAQGIAYHALALKIYNSHGETEYTDEEFQLMLQYAEFGMTPSFIESLRILVETKKGE